MGDREDGLKKQEIWGVQVLGWYVGGLYRCVLLPSLSPPLACSCLHQAALHHCHSDHPEGEG